jgi:polyferredoxin
MSNSADVAQVTDTAGRAGTRRKTKPTIHWLRLGVQTAVAVFIVLLSVGHTLTWSWSANLHSICPFGGVANLYTYFTTGGYMAKLHSAVFVMLLALLIGLVLTGKSFCGWICPLGTVQEALGKVGRRLWPRLYNRVPRRVESVLRYGKYVMLIWIIVQTARSARLFFESFDPYYNLFSIWSDQIAWVGYAVVVGTLLTSLFIERPFSRYACPLGAMNGFFNSFSLFQIKRDASTCTDCGRCDKACPVKIEVSKSAAVRNTECTRCLECVEACPVNSRTGNTLKLRAIFPWTWIGRKALPSRVFATIAVLAFAAPIGITIGTGDFAVTNTHVYSSPADIKGSSPLADIVENFSVSKAALYNGLGIPTSVSSATQVKDVAAKMGLPEGEETVSPAIIREIITYLDAPLTTFVTEAGADATAIASAASAAGLTESSTLRQLMERGAPGAVLQALTTAPAAASDDTSTTTTGAASTSAPTQTPTSTPTDGATEEVKGSTTLDQVKGMVSDFPAFLSEFGIDSSEPGAATLKDLKTKYGFELDAVRTYIGDHR